jgi:hypothetical protein
MVPADDLRAALETAFVHTKPDGVLLLTPDCTRETLKPGTDTGGHDGEGRSLRYLEWTHAPNEGASAYEVDYAIMLREADGSVRLVHDRHRLGLFSHEEWVRAIEEVGYELVEVDVEDPYPDEHVVFVARRPG